jgi:Tfp pilus assembly protein PilO
MRNVGAVVVAGLVVVIGAWYVLFWRSETSHFRAEQQAQLQAASNVTSLESQLTALVALQKRMPTERAELAALRQDVPEGPSLDELLVAIINASTKAGVSVTSIGTPEPSGWGGSAAASGAAGGGPQSMTIPITVTASSSQVLHFISSLESSPRLFVVNEFSLNSPASSIGPVAGTRASTTLSVEAFYVSAASNDPASNFSLPLLGRSRVGAGTSHLSLRTYDLAAKANAVAAAAAETQYFAQHRTFVGAGNGGFPPSARKLPWSGSGSPAPGEISAAAGKLVGGHLGVASYGGGEGAALVESLSRSGMCFYVALYPKGAGRGEAYAETTGGCASTIAFPKSVGKGQAGRSKVGLAATGVAGNAWYGSW